MKAFIKKYWLILTIFLFIDAFFIVTCTIPTDKELTRPGGLNEVLSLISVDGATKLEGSINTIYVKSYDNPTIMQTLLVGLNNADDVSVSNPNYALSFQESQLSGLIQKNQSIEACLIAAYQAAILKGYDFNLDYEFMGCIVYTYQKKQPVMRIGDVIYKIKKANDQIIDNTDRQALKDALNSLTIGDTIYYQREKQLREYTITEELNSSSANRFFCYEKYQINQESAYPHFTLHAGNTLGPSGGFLQAISVYCQITKQDLTGGKKIAGTGTISVDGAIGRIGGIKQKIKTALRNNVDIFLCPSDHYEEAYEEWLKLANHEKMQLIEISNSEADNLFDSALIQTINYLEELL